VQDHVLFIVSTPYWAVSIFLLLQKLGVLTAWMLWFSILNCRLQGLILLGSVHGLFSLSTNSPLKFAKHFPLMNIRLLRFIILTVRRKLA
jgi:hypothetical protein